MNDQTQTTERTQPQEFAVAQGGAISRVDGPYNKATVDRIEVKPGEGVLFKDLPQLIEASKLMARAGIAVSSHCRDNPGVCFAILMRTENWRLRDPFFVAEHSYVVRKKENIDGRWETVETLAFDASVFHAIISANAPIKDGLIDFEFRGTGEDRICIARVELYSGRILEHESPKFKDCHPGYSEKDGKKFVKGSPLWDRDPDQQHAYWTKRAMCRRYFPHILGGVYDRDEFEETPIGPGAAALTPNLIDRLSGRMTEGKGFHPDNVANGIKDAAGDDAAPSTKTRADHGGAAAGSRNTGGPAADTVAQEQHDEDGVVLPAKGTAHAPDGPEATNPPQDAQGAQAAPAGGKKRQSRKTAATEPASEVLKPDPDALPEPWVRRSGVEYVTYAKGWMDRASDAIAIDQRWDTERKIRNALGIGLDADQMDILHRYKSGAKDRCKAAQP